ncbi:MAG: hypothetical protein M3R03_10890 [Pseudomonadota bacterium]|nr:hypothetical protein [Pseudomonadota bacterium]
MANKLGSLTLGFAIVAGMSFTACGKKSDDDIPVPASQSKSGRVEDQFGKGFGKAFRADKNSEPASVSENDMRPVSLTEEPIEIN